MLLLQSLVVRNHPPDSLVLYHVKSEQDHIGSRDGTTTLFVDVANCSTGPAVVETETISRHSNLANRLAKKAQIRVLSVAPLHCPHVLQVKDAELEATATWVLKPKPLCVAQNQQLWIGVNSL